jgi:hypothetical protein
VLSSVLTLVSTLVVGAPGAAPVTGLSLGAWAQDPPRPDLALKAGAIGPAIRVRLSIGRRDPGGAGSDAPVCSGDVCQAAVSVPGFDPGLRRASRSELFVALLTKARVEPLATAAWALVSTGLRFDWTPPVLDGANSAARGGWGSVMLRLGFRLDAVNGVVIPPRPR